MKKTVVVILSMMILCVIAAMGVVVTMTPAPQPQPAVQAQEVPAVQETEDASVWKDAGGRFTARNFPGWDMMNAEQAQELFRLTEEKGRSSAREQAALLNHWMNTGDSVLFISPGRRSSVVISCQTMNTELTDEYVSNIRTRYAQEVESTYAHMETADATDAVLAQSGNRIAGVRCDNRHPSAWLMKMDAASSHVFFTWQGRNLYTIVISDTDQSCTESVCQQMLDQITLG